MPHSLDRLRAAVNAADPGELRRRLDETPNAALLSERLSTLRRGEIEWVYVQPPSAVTPIPPR